MKWGQNSKVVNLVALGALAICFSAAPANAQNVYAGKFTLPVEARWGTARLPAGDYTLTLESAAADYRLIVRGKDNGAIILAASADQRVLAERSQLTLVETQQGYAIRSLEVPELGLTFEYWVPKPGRILAEHRPSTRDVAVARIGK